MSDCRGFSLLVHTVNQWVRTGKHTGIQTSLIMENAKDLVQDFGLGLYQEVWFFLADFDHALGSSPALEKPQNRGGIVWLRIAMTINARRLPDHAFWLVKRSKIEDQGSHNEERLEKVQDQRSKINLRPEGRGLRGFRHAHVRQSEATILHDEWSGQSRPARVLQVHVWLVIFVFPSYSYFFLK